MNKLVIPLATLLFVAGCTPKVEPDPVHEDTVVSGTIRPFTKMALGDDGLSLKWSEGDAIGIVTSENGNCRFSITSSTAGMSTAKFSSSQKLEGIVNCAYFPYSSSTDGKEIKMKLPASQTQNGYGPDMSLNVCTAGKPSGSEKSGYEFTFNRKLSLLKFIVRTNDRLAGETLKSISLRVENMPVIANPALTGDFNLKLSATEQSLKFTECIDSVILNFAGSPVLKKNDSIVGWVFINPCKAAEQPLAIRIKTDRTSMIVDGFRTPVGGWTEGRRMIYDFDLAALDVSGDLIYEGEEIPMDKQFLKLSAPGAYNMSGTTIKALASYTKGLSQYSFHTGDGINYCRVVDMPAGVAFKAGVSSSLRENGSGVIATSAVGLPDVVSSNGKSVECIKRSEDAVWVVDRTNKIGYIIALQ